MTRHPLYPWIVDNKYGLTRMCERCNKRIAYLKPQTVGQFAKLKHEFLLKHSLCALMNTGKSEPEIE